MCPWKPGEVIVLSGTWRDRVWWALPVNVVRDDHEITALYWQAGTPNKMPDRRVTPQDLRSEDGLPLVDSHWVKTDVLMLVPPEAAYAVYAMWEAGHKRFICWYVNLQAPLLRKPFGFETTDYILDIVIQPDRSAWRWKDEDEFNESVSIGVYSIGQARAIRAEGETVIQRMQANLSPFCDGWECWSPPADWSIPKFPTGWDKRK